MTIFIASDHAGFSMKQMLAEHLRSSYAVKDLGPASEERCDYPDFADQVSQQVLKNSGSVGILLCGSGQGMAMRANKYKNIRAALCWSEEVGELSRAHNDANVLCLGARLLPAETLIKITEIFLKTPFEGDRHSARVQKISRPTE